ncbi:MAG TPA: hypothetical protein VFJ82_08245 [Longimicrobium sp.]|nr:hypothetical protein [Longimicrobium sp.]
MDLSHEERIAALLDGKYSDAEREKLLAQLAANDDDMEMLAAVASALREYEEEERRDGATPLHAPVPAVTPASPVRRRWKPPRWVGLAAAAGLAALIVGPLLWRNRDGGFGTPTQVVAELSHPTGIPAGFAMTPLPASRGSGETPLGPGEAVRLGARLADLELLAAAHDPRASEAATDVADLLHPVTGAGDLVRYYEGLAQRRPPPRPDSDFVRRAAGLGGRNAELGAWIETARVAAASSDVKFFRSSPSRKVLKGRGAGEGLPQREVDTLRHAVAGAEASPAGWSELRKMLDDLLRKRAGDAPAQGSTGA